MSTGDNKIQSFTDLNTWKQGHRLVIQLYKVTKSFPTDERFGLVDQIRRAAVSIPQILQKVLVETPTKIKYIFITFPWVL